jgi:uncharacterized protein YndB with AHSA1/START domain
MNTEEKTTLTMPSDTEIVVTREFDAPPALVWKAWTDPEHLPRWWGPMGFTTTTSRMEIKPGGQWRFVMHGPDGTDYENLITIREVVPHSRLAYEHGGEADLEPVNFRVVVTFAPRGPSGGRTLLTMTSIFPSKQARDFVLREYGAGEGAKQHLNRLAEHLATMGPGGSEPFVTTRVFDAPRELVWSAWTSPEHLPKWFGPKGVTIPRFTLDLRIGGTFHYCMRGPDGSELWGKWTFREIAAPDRLVFVLSFADAAGKPVRAPFAADWPLEMLSTITFAQHAGKGGGTVVSVRSEPINATAAERKTFDDGKPSMTQGWTGTLDQLAGHLRAAR